MGENNGGLREQNEAHETEDMAQSTKHRELGITLRTSHYILRLRSIVKAAPEAFLETRH